MFRQFWVTPMEEGLIGRLPPYVVSCPRPQHPVKERLALHIVADVNTERRDTVLLEVFILVVTKDDDSIRSKLVDGPTYLAKCLYHPFLVLVCQGFP